MNYKTINSADWIDISVPVSEKMAVFAYEQKPRFERRAQWNAVTWAIIPQSIWDPYRHTP